MSMNFSEFKRLLGAEPRSGDPEFLRACQSSPEFEREAAEAQRLRTSWIAPWHSGTCGLIEDLMTISQQPPAMTGNRRWLKFALAASLFVAVGAAGLVWKMNQGLGFCRRVPC